MSNDAALLRGIMAKGLQYLNDENFQKEIETGVTLVDFYADWCGPCRMMEPIIHELADEMGDKVKVAKIDIESSQRTTASFQVTSIPTIIIFKDGSEVERIVGLKDKDTLKRILAGKIGA